MKEFYLHIGGHVIPGVHYINPNVPPYHLMTGFLFEPGTSKFYSEHEMLDEVRDWARALNQDDTVRIVWIEPGAVMP